MKQQDKKEWISALESGDYKKGRYALCLNENYCCLGVLAEINGYLSKNKIDGNKYLLNSDKNIGDFFGGGEYLGYERFRLQEKHHNDLACINDRTDDFSEVIEYIKENIETA